jgi:serine/threonine protein kinase
VPVTESRHDGRPIVEKRLSSRDRDEPEAVRALLAEGALLGAIGGRGAPRLVEVGSDEGGPFVRMERVPFATLATRIGAVGDPAFVDRAFRAALLALATIHEAEDDRGPLAIVHGDLSPPNIAVDDRGEHAVLLDFGLAVYRDSSPRDGAFRGTVAYVAPEVARGETPSVRSDLYSLAASLLHVRDGKPPRSGPSLAALIASAADEPIRIPDDAGLAACLAHDPAARPASARVLLARL